MAIQIIKEPAELSTAKNAILYRLKTTSQSTQFFLCKIYMESEIYSGDFVNIFPDDGTAEAKPHPETQIADFDLSRFILDFLEKDFDEHEPNSDEVEKKKYLTRRFYVEFAEFITSEGTFTAQPQKFVIYAGFEHPDFASRGWQLMPQNQFILSTAPRPFRVINTLQNVPIFFLPKTSGTQTVTLKISYSDNTNTSQTITVSAPKYEVFAINFGFTARNYSNSANIANIEISFLDEKINLIPLKSENCQNTKEFYYLNSLGGLEAFMCDGEQITEGEINQDTFLRFTPYDASKNELRAEDTYNSKYNLIFTIKSGYMPKANRNALIDFLISTKRWVLERGVLIPIILVNPKLPKDSDENYFKSIEFSYKYAFQETNFNFKEALK